MKKNKKNIFLYVLNIMLLFFVPTALYADVEVPSLTQRLESIINNVAFGEDDYYELDIGKMVSLQNTANFLTETLLSDGYAQLMQQIIDAAKATSGQNNENPIDEAMKSAKDIISQLKTLGESLNNSGLAVTNSLEVWPLTRMMVFGSIHPVLDVKEQANLSGAVLTTLLDYISEQIFDQLLKGATGNEIMTAEEARNFLTQFLKELKDGWIDKIIKALGFNAGTPGGVTAPNLKEGEYKVIDIIKIAKDLLAERANLSPPDYENPDLSGGEAANASQQLSVASGAKYVANVTKAEAIVRMTQEMDKIGLFTTTDTIYTRTRTVGIIILMAAFFARVFYMVLANVIGTGKFGGIAPWALIGKTVFYILIILAIPNIAVFGMKISDALQTSLFRPDDIEGQKGYNAVQERSLALVRLNDMTAVRTLAVGGRPEGEFQSWGFKIGTGLQWLFGLKTTEEIMKDIAIAIIIYAIGYCALAVVSTTLILADLMMGMTLCFAPICLGLSLFPSCEKWTEHVLKSWLTYVTMGPMCAIYILIVTCIFAMSANVTLVTFLITSIVIIKMAGMIPQLSEQMSAAALTGAVAGLAAIPGKTASWATGSGIAGGIGGAARLGGRGLGKAWGAAKSRFGY